MGEGARRVKVLRIHNHYREAGGESAIHAAENALLERAGWEVLRYERHNDEIVELGPLGRAQVAADAVWSGRTWRELRAQIARERPDVAHLTNTFPLISPSAIEACYDAGVPVVLSLHNYRLLCPAANLMRKGRACEECVDHSLLRGVVHGCYRGSRSATAVAAAMLAVHRRRETFSRKVDAFVALTGFARQTFAAAGLPAERIVVKPNFVDPDPGERPSAGESALFVGRLSDEKGLDTLLDAWAKLDAPIPLRIAGDGPLRPFVARRLADPRLSRVQLLGPIGRRAVIESMREARALVFPSRCYEGFPLVIAEAFACGVPVVASRLGSMAEIVEDGRTGLHFTPGNADDLAAVVARAWAEPKRLEDMGRAARRVFEQRYTAERNLDMLLDIYHRALSRSSPTER